MSAVNDAGAELAEMAKRYCHNMHIVMGPCMRDPPATSLSSVENSNAQLFAVTSFALCNTGS